MIKHDRGTVIVAQFGDGVGAKLVSVQTLGASGFKNGKFVGTSAATAATVNDGVVKFLVGYPDGTTKWSVPFDLSKYKSFDWSGSDFGPKDTVADWRMNPAFTAASGDDDPPERHCPAHTTEPC